MAIIDYHEPRFVTRQRLARSRHQLVAAVVVSALCTLAALLA